MEIADKVGIRYFFGNLSGFPHVLISDFLIITSKGEMVKSKRRTVGKAVEKDSREKREAGDSLRLTVIKLEMSIKSNI